MTGWAHQVDGEPDLARDRLRRAIGTVADVVRDPESRVSLLDVVQTPAQRELAYLGASVANDCHY